jgi:hypothetical protein
MASHSPRHLSKSASAISMRLRKSFIFARVPDFSHVFVFVMVVVCFRPVAFRSQTYRGMPTPPLQWTAECQLLGKICPRNATDWAAPLLNFPGNATNCVAILSLSHSVAHICGRNVPSPRHFTLRVPQFEVSYLFAARLVEYKIHMRRIV